MKRPSLKISGLKTWYADQKQKRKEEAIERKKHESPMLKMLAFVVTLVAMAIGMSILPLFPPPLPIFLAVLVAFLVYQYPIVGMPIGGAVIGLGLLFNLSQPGFYFISYLGSEQIRVGFVVVTMALLIGLPIAFNRYKSVLAIDFGILAVAALSSSSTYFLAIPLLFASAVYFKRQVVLTVVFYALLTIPLQIVQYYQYTVAPILQSDWWNVPGTSPPIFVSLQQIFSSLGSSIAQFRLFDVSQVIYNITGQLTWIPNANINGHNLGNAMTQYLDSAPGLIMFVVIVVGLAMGGIYFTRLLIRSGSGGLSDKLLPIFTATIAAALFFILMGALGTPLAFSADTSPGTLILGTLATLLFTLPIAFINTNPKQTTTPQMITDKLKGLIAKAHTLVDQIDNVKANIPVVVSVPEGKISIIKDNLEDTLRKSESQLYDPVEMDKKFAELDPVGEEIDAVDSELNALLAEYQIFVNCEYSNWIGKLTDIGLDVQSTLTADYLKAMTLDERIDAIKQTLEAGRTLAKNVMLTAEPIYFVVRSLYDPSLPETSRAIEFTNKKIEAKEAPWIAIEALYNSLNNWSRQYGADILSSMRYLKDSLTPIANLSSESDMLPPVFGENLSKVLDYAKKAEGMRLLVGKKVEKEKLSIVDVVSLKNDIQTFLAIAQDVLSMLYTELVTEEDTIDRLLPTKEYIWETNSNLRERLKRATDALANSSDYKINQIMENLPKSLAYVDETVQTLAVYSERREFLLNYPTAEAAIEEQLKTKNRLTPKDLPFQTRFAGEYLRLYYSQRFSEYFFDKDSMQLTKRD
ncbi:MAG TPA: hypothetical protein VLV84_01635 [Candidatus Acidoferrales bacterium]|nr:hypothetical protein [Candidatus Acidoferrales bacterium]